MSAASDSETRLQSLLDRRAEIIADTSRRGRGMCAALARATDDWLAALLLEASDGNTEGLALVATGGYGRLELAPGSDLDVWLLHSGQPGVQRLAERLWYPIWDAGLKLGHAVRTRREALAIIGNDLDTATASLTARHIVGDESLSSDLASEAVERWIRRSGKWLDELHRRVVARHEAAGEVAFLLEPDLKEGRGGLRDIHALRWAETAGPVLLAGDATALTGAEELLLDVRVALHRVVGRGHDQLLLERQDEVAALLGGGDADALMARVSEAARTVAWVSDEAWRRVDATRRRRSRIFRREREVLPGVMLRDGEVHVADDLDIANDPSIVLRTGAAAALSDAPIDRTSLDRLATQAPELVGPWPADAKEALVTLLRTGRPAIAVLEALDQRRLVERVLPEWKPVRSRPQRNALHRFSVDRHLMEAVANAAALAEVVSRPDLLVVGALLHDIGKGYPGDHTEAGLVLVREIAPRMGFPDADVATILKLVQHHLLLPDVATRRDLGDDDVIRDVAASVGSLLELELLAALTEADSLATGPSAWNAWKAELMGQLVERVAHVLRGGDAAEASRPAGFPGRAVLDLMREGRVVVRSEPPLITVVAPDRPGLFSRVAGALALHGVTVHAADAHSEDGAAASQFRVESGDPNFDWEAVIVDIRRAIEGRLAIDARLAQRSRAYRRMPAAMRLVGEPSVRVDNNASSNSTVVEVRAPDRLGALYRITRALADLDLDIRIAKVSTLGHEVVDAFYVRTATGGKLLDREHVKELERAILHQLSL